MKFSTRFRMQSLSVLLIAILTASAFGFIYCYIYKTITRVPVNSVQDASVIILRNDEPVYKSGDFSSSDIAFIQMNLSVNKSSFEKDGKNYNVVSDEFREQSEKYQIIRLVPTQQNRQIIVLALILIISFILALAIGFFVIFRNIEKFVTKPVVILKNKTEALAEGNLDGGIKTLGYGEIRELSDAIERLRQRLSDSLYYQKKADDDRSFLISSISHDLRTPVTSIRGYIEGIKDGVADTDLKKAAYLDKALEKTYLLNNMIEDLLLYSRLDLHKTEFNIKETDICEFLKDCVSDNHILFEKESKKISFEGEKTFVSIDPEKFRRVVQNIVDNAKKNIESGTGALNIYLRITGNSAIIEFNDNGKGINENDLPHIFERFYRADSARTANGSSGLGLAIAKQMVEGMGGRIWALNNERGGASILISLRRVTENEKDSDN